MGDLKKKKVYQDPDSKEEDNLVIDHLREYLQLFAEIQIEKENKKRQEEKNG